MLTPDDEGPDGNSVDYLRKQEQYRRFDPNLFDKLRAAVWAGKRSVNMVEEAEILPSSRFYRQLLLDDADSRQGYFEGFWELAQGCDLVFFDPDIGMEVRSTPYGRKRSSQYLYWGELIDAFSKGYSTLVYQHFPRVEREPYILDMAQRCIDRTGAKIVYSFKTNHVVFFLLPSEPHVDALERNIARVETRWRGEIATQRHTSTTAAGHKAPRQRRQATFDSRDDAEAVRRVLRNFFEALDGRDHKRALETWHPEGNLFIGGVAQSQSFFQSLPPFIRFRVDEVRCLEVEGSIATARVGWRMEMPGSMGVHVSYFHLVEGEVSWRIVSQVDLGREQPGT
jgi:hypothetical protein